MNEFIKGCLFILIIQCLLFAGSSRFHQEPGNQVSIEKFSGEADADQNEHHPEQSSKTSECDGNAPCYVASPFRLSFTFGAVPVPEFMEVLRSSYVPDIHIPPARF